jgi:hypothetical protein
MIRRRPAHRLTSALIGAIIAALGVLTMALLSGRDLDTELIAIVALAAIGGWLLITALLAGRRPRAGQWAGQAEPSVYAGTATTSAPARVVNDHHDDDDDADADAEDDASKAGEPPLTAAARKAAARAKVADTAKQPKVVEPD